MGAQRPDERGVTQVMEPRMRVLRFDEDLERRDDPVALHRSHQLFGRRLDLSEYGTEGSGSCP